MDRRRLWLAGMWIAAIVAIGAIYLTLEPEHDDVRTRQGDEAPTFVAFEDVVEGESRIGLPVADEEGDASRYRLGVRHTARSPFRGPAHPERAWRYRTSGRISAQPVVAPDGSVYVGSHDYRFHAVSAEGQGLWTARMHQRVWSAAAVVGDTVYVGSDADAFFALDRASGETRWRVRAEGDADGAPAVFGDVIYFTAGPHLYAVTLDGELRWRFRGRGPFLLSSPAVDSDGTVYAASIDDHVYAVAPDGRMRWAYQSGGDISSSPVIGDTGLIYFGSDDQHVHAVDRDGNRRWRVHVDGYVRAPVALGRSGEVYAAVYGPRPRVVSLDAEDGELRWYFPIAVVESSEVGIASGPLVDADGNLYFGAHDDFLYSIGPDGELRWIHQLGADIDSAPVLREDGTLLLGCDDGFLYAIAERGRAAEDGGVETPGAGDPAGPATVPAEEPDVDSAGSPSRADVGLPSQRRGR